MSDTLLLDRTTWDLLVDASGNIAVASAPYATAQDVATEWRLFQGDYWYDLSAGLPYLQDILGQSVSVAFLRTTYQRAALAVPNVATCTFDVVSVTGRRLVGQGEITDSSGTTQTVSTA